MVSIKASDLNAIDRFMRRSGFDALSNFRQAARHLLAFAEWAIVRDSHQHVYVQHQALDADVIAQLQGVEQDCWLIAPDPISPEDCSHCQLEWAWSLIDYAQPATA